MKFSQIKFGFIALLIAVTVLFTSVSAFATSDTEGESESQSETVIISETEPDTEDGGDASTEPPEESENREPSSTESGETIRQKQSLPPKPKQDGIITARVPARAIPAAAEIPTAEITTQAAAIRTATKKPRTTANLPFILSLTTAKNALNSTLKKKVPFPSRRKSRSARALNLPGGFLTPSLKLLGIFQRILPKKAL